MKKLFTVVALAVLCCVAANGQNRSASDTNADKFAGTAKMQSSDTAPVKVWTYGGDVGLTVSQAAYSNWSQGGNNSIAFTGSFNYNLNYLKGKHLWTSRLELAFGVNNTAGTGLRKTSDKIYFTTNYGYMVAPKLYLGVLGTFSTQFANGYDYTTSTTNYISRFMAPGYLSVGLGLTYKPLTWLTLILSPLNLRETFVEDKMLSDLGSFGVTPGKRLLTQFGANLRVEATKELWKNLSLYTRLDLFSNYLKNPQNLVVNWDVQLKYAFSSWFTVNLNLGLVYDENILFGGSSSTVGGPRVQFQELFGLGLQAKF